jgi:hypothetical protein
MKARAFVDSSVLFSAVYSTSGHSSDLLVMGAEGDILAVISDLSLLKPGVTFASSNLGSSPILIGFL